MTINVVNVTQAYDNNVVLNNVSFELRTGSITALMGRSGCGKSTLLRMLGGVRPQGVRTPTSGEIFLDGQPVVEQSDDAVTVFQRYSNRPDLTIEQNVAFPFTLGLWRKKVQADEAKQRVAAALAEVGLSDKAKLYPHQLSGGQNQRVALARALVVQPRFLLMDEPFGALDPIIRRQMQELLVKLLKQHQTTVVLVTHDPEEALRLGDRVLVLAGKPASIALDLSQAGSTVELGLRMVNSSLEERIISTLS